MSSESEWANPGSLGLMAFGICMIVTGLHLMGYWHNTPALAFAATMGGLGLYLAGIIDLKRNNIVGGTAFALYGTYWWTFWTLVAIGPKLGLVLGHPELAAFMIMGAIYTIPLFVAAPSLQGVGKFVCGTLILLEIFFIAGAAAFYGYVPIATVGAIGVIDGIWAWYDSTAILVNTGYGRKILPIA